MFGQTNRNAERHWRALPTFIIDKKEANHTFIHRHIEIGEKSGSVMNHDSFLCIVWLHTDFIRYINIYLKSFYIYYRDETIDRPRVLKIAHVRGPARSLSSRVLSLYRHWGSKMSPCLYNPAGGALWTIHTFSSHVEEVNIQNLQQVRLNFHLDDQVSGSDPQLEVKSTYLYQLHES